MLQILSTTKLTHTQQNVVQYFFLHMKREK